MPGTILLIATLDTKGDEIAYVRDLIQKKGHATLVLDAGVLGTPAFAADVTAASVADAGGAALDTLRRQGDRGAALEVMARGAAAVAGRLHAEGRIAAVLGIGGSCGTAIATAAMRALPIGLPKVMVSTVASGQVSSYVGVTDIAMLYPVVDIAGLNRISRRILANAAGAVCGMVEQAPPDAPDKPVVAATMFGVTTPCVERVRKHLEDAGFEVLVFHATGSGGRAMEGLIGAGFVAGVADVTTTEWADELVGGILAAGPERLDAAGRAGIPQVVSVGALDMVNFGPRATVPERFAGRTLHVHNPSVTLMRTTAAECARLGEIIASKLNAAKGPTTLLLPLRGVSAIDREGQPFHDPAADAALFEALKRGAGAHVTVRELDLHINDPEFADAIASELLAHLRTHPRTGAPTHQRTDESSVSPNAVHRT
jgi:uncharacterized protein (UPF0261 family)